VEHILVHISLASFCFAGLRPAVHNLCATPQVYLVVIQRNSGLCSRLQTCCIICNYAAGGTPAALLHHNLTVVEGCDAAKQNEILLCHLISGGAPQPKLIFIMFCWTKSSSTQQYAA